jgi:hypothetical protein
MNDTPTSDPHREEGEEDEMLPEYDFDYRKTRPNRFALRGREDISWWFWTAMSRKYLPLLPL